MDKLDQLLADAAELLKLPPEQMALVIRERQLKQALEIAQSAAIADARATNDGKWFDKQRAYEASIIKQSAPPFPKHS